MPVNHYFDKPIAKILQCLCIVVVAFFCACSGDSEASIEDVSGTTVAASVVDLSSSIESSSSEAIVYPESFKPDDEEYPYAGIPRIVIYTNNQKKIKNRETEIPARLQIWGEKEAESEILDLTIRGRGNSSWNLMPQKSYKIEFVNKQKMLGMPKDRDWALIANYADKSLMKNYLMYHLSTELGAFYSPRCEYAELYLNEEYLGVYLLTETIKISKKRVNVPEDDNSYLVEVDGKYHDDEQVVFSDTIQNSYDKNSFRIHEPKNASEQVLQNIENRIRSFESYLINITENADNKINRWINIDDYVKYYWVQEFSKNPDAGFNTSVYFVWENDSALKMGPVWDFDISCGGHNDVAHIHPEDWYIKDASWNAYVFKDSVMNQARIDFWKKNKSQFERTLDVVDSLQTVLNDAAQNNLKKWDILGSTSIAYFHNALKSYDEAVDDLKKWLTNRIQWIDQQISPPLNND